MCYIKGRFHVQVFVCWFNYKWELQRFLMADILIPLILYVGIDAQPKTGW